VCLVRGLPGEVGGRSILVRILRQPGQFIGQVMEALRHPLLSRAGLLAELGLGLGEQLLNLLAGFGGDLGRLLLNGAGDLSPGLLSRAGDLTGLILRHIGGRRLIVAHGGITLGWAGAVAR